MNNLVWEGAVLRESARPVKSGLTPQAPEALQQRPYSATATG